LILYDTKQIHCTYRNNRARLSLRNFPLIVKRISRFVRSRNPNRRPRQTLCGGVTRPPSRSPHHEAFYTGLRAFFAGFSVQRSCEKALDAPRQILISPAHISH
jgi:hypothetical protein